jgi:hypothetical protein
VSRLTQYSTVIVAEANPSSGWVKPIIGASITPHKKALLVNYFICAGIKIGYLNVRHKNPRMQALFDE